jgi:uncharacterized membrane protein YbjE (DUF340 family)
MISKVLSCYFPVRLGKSMLHLFIKRLSPLFLPFLRMHMTVLTTLGPLLLALLLGYWINVSAFTPTRVAMGLNQLTYLILGLIGFSIGILEDVTNKLLTAGTQALVYGACILFLSLGALYLSGRWMSNNTPFDTHTEQAENRFNWRVFKEAGHTFLWVIMGIIAGVIISHMQWGIGHYIEASITWLLYLLLYLVGCQLRQGEHRLRKLFLNTQGVIIAAVTLLSTLFSGYVGSMLLGHEWYQGMAAVSGFGWYSLSGILISGLGDPALGTTAFLLDISREILALMLIPIFARYNHHLSVGFSGATAMDFTLPMLGKYHGIHIVPVAVASGFILSFLAPILIPIFMGFSSS